MNPRRVTWTFVLLLGMLVQASAQLTLASKLFEETKVKAETGDATAQHNLGVIYSYGDGVPKDEAEGVKWYRKAAHQGNAKAQFNLGYAYAKGEGVTKDAAEAVKWFRKTADQGDTEAQYTLGRMYANGEGVAKDQVEAGKWFRKAADQGTADQQFYLGVRYSYGDGVAKDEAEAVMWYRKAADQGNANAQYNLGVNYANGEGVAKDETEAVKWYRKAADQGNATAQFNLGVMYRDGQGVEKDYAEAVKWYRKAADQGYAPAQSNLGVMYQNGQGVAKDEAEAVKWYRKAADQGDASAQFNLGMMYAKGNGVAKDEAEAVKWYRKAADQGDANAQLNLGVMYANGNGVAKDETEAYKWMLLAGAQADKDARKNIPVIERRLTPEQRAEGQRLAKAFKPRQGLSTGDPVSREGVTESRPEATGTGFFITEDGYLITNEHVTGEGASVRVLTAGGILQAKVVKVDRANDLALLKVEGRFAALPVTMSRKVKLGGTVATVGFPNIGLQGFAPKLAKGEIASLSGAQDDARYFQISVPVQPGNSGGALVDERGNVVGVVSAKLNARAALSTSGALPENVNYAVKSSYLLSFLESVPEVAARLRDPESKERKFEDVVRSAEQAAVLVLVY